MQLNSDQVAGSGDGLKAEIGTFLGHRRPVCFDLLHVSAAWRDFWPRTSGEQSSRAIPRCCCNTEGITNSIVYLRNDIKAQSRKLQSSDLANVPDVPF